MRLPGHLLAFVGCLGLVAVYTWPLAGDPGHLVPDNTDPRLFTWVMLTVFRNLGRDPGLLLHGNAFYPLGSSLSFAEPLLTPALLAGPLFAWSGNPYLAYNLTLLAFWAASGWAIYAVSVWLTRDHLAALVATVIFTVSPPRLAYGVEFQMELLFGLPLVMYTFVRYLEEQRPRYLIASLAVFWLQAVAVWYFAVLLGFGLAWVALAYAARRWTGWRAGSIVVLGGGAVALGAALAPVAWPFFVTRRELGFERGLADALDRSANALTYVTTRGTWWQGLVDVHFVSETTLFPGLGALALATMGLARWHAGAPRREWTADPARPARHVGRWPERLLDGGVALLAALAVVSAVGGGRLQLGPAWTRLPSFTTFGVGALACLLAGDLLAGWRRWRAGMLSRRLEPAEWARLLAGVALLAFLLSLGPVVFVGPYEAGAGLYAWLHSYALPLRAIRGTTRFGLLVLLAVALLAALGARRLAAGRSPRVRASLTVAFLAWLLAEYAVRPVRYEHVPTYRRPVDAVLRADPDDVAVLEWPLNDPFVDVDAKLRSVGHGKRVVNGFAGFVPDLQRTLSGLLSQTQPSLPTPETEAALRRLYPLRYLIVRLADPRLPAGTRGDWLALRAGPPPLLRFRGTFGDDDLYELAPLPERGRRLERWVSYDFLRTHPALSLTVRPVRPDPALEQWVTISLNGTDVGRARLDAPVTFGLTLAAPLHRAAPNVVALDHAYRRVAGTSDPAYRIGTTGVTSPIDLAVSSAGQPHGDRASIRLGLSEVARNRRGYNLAALDARGGRLLGSEAFDTLGDEAASYRLQAWVATWPAGTIVAGAVKDEASGWLTAEAVRALGSLGVRGDLRGRFRESHAFLGVKGAPPGTAAEALGPRAVEVEVGRPDPGVGLELVELSLAP